MVLLDLLGAPQPTFYSYFSETEGWYYQLADIEARLGAAGQLVDHAHSSATIQHQKRNQGYFQPFGFRAKIEDDHIPFLEKNVITPSYCFSFAIIVLITFFSNCPGSNSTLNSNTIPRSMAYLIRRHTCN